MGGTAGASAGVGGGGCAFGCSDLDGCSEQASHQHS
jgi:hypothetical protein